MWKVKNSIRQMINEKRHKGKERKKEQMNKLIATDERKN